MMWIKQRMKPIKLEMYNAKTTLIPFTNKQEQKNHIDDSK